MSEKMAEPKNIPHNWDYQSEFHTVTCAGCSFRYGAEHPDSDGWWTCPNCGNGNNPARASSPAQEPVTTEAVAWRWKVHGIWHYAGGFPVSGAEPLYTLPAPLQPGRDANDKHYLAAIRHHLKRLYSVYPNNARLREQISDEIDWIDATLIGEPK